MTELGERGSGRESNSHLRPIFPPFLGEVRTAVTWLTRKRVCAVRARGSDIWAPTTDASVGPAPPGSELAGGRREA